MTIKILIIDPDDSSTLTLSAALEAMGASVLISKEGKQGIKTAESENPSLIILAVELKQTSGYFICKKIKRNAKLKKIPLFLISSEATEDMFEGHKRLKSRADQYFLKPIPIPQFKKSVGKYVDLDGSSQAANENQGPTSSETDKGFFSAAPEEEFSHAAESIGPSSEYMAMTGENEPVTSMDQGESVALTAAMSEISSLKKTLTEKDTLLSVKEREILEQLAAFEEKEQALSKSLSDLETKTEKTANDYTSQLSEKQAQLKKQEREISTLTGENSHLMAQIQEDKKNTEEKAQSAFLQKAEDLKNTIQKEAAKRLNAAQDLLKKELGQAARMAQDEHKSLLGQLDELKSQLKENEERSQTKHTKEIELLHDGFEKQTSQAVNEAKDALKEELEKGEGARLEKAIKDLKTDKERELEEFRSAFESGQSEEIEKQTQSQQEVLEKALDDLRNELKDEHDLVIAKMREEVDSGKAPLEEMDSLKKQLSTLTNDLNEKKDALQKNETQAEQHINEMGAMEQVVQDFTEAQGRLESRSKDLIKLIENISDSTGTALLEAAENGAFHPDTLDKVALTEKLDSSEAGDHKTIVRIKQEGAWPKTDKPASPENRLLLSAMQSISTVIGEALIKATDACEKAQDEVDLLSLASDESVAAANDAETTEEEAVKLGTAEIEVVGPVDSGDSPPAVPENKGNTPPTNETNPLDDEDLDALFDGLTADSAPTDKKVENQ